MDVKFSVLVHGSIHLPVDREQFNTLHLAQARDAIRQHVSSRDGVDIHRVEFYEIAPDD